MCLISLFVFIAASDLMYCNVFIVNLFKQLEENDLRLFFSFFSADFSLFVSVQVPSGGNYCGIRYRV